MDQTDDQPASTPARHQALLNRLKLPAILIGIGIVVAAIIIIFIRPNAKNQASTQFPQTTIRAIHGFTFYYFKPSFNTDFALVPGSISYNAQVLIFQLKNSQNKTLSVTEEATPPNFDTTGLKADKDYQNEVGHAYISDLLDRTTGALFTSDGTWLLINAPKPIGASAMQQVLDNLAPDKLKS